jgi:peptidoglycan-associated lipoprotein
MIAVSAIMRGRSERGAPHAPAQIRCTEGDMRRLSVGAVLAVVLLSFLIGCGPKPAPVAAPTTPTATPPGVTTTTSPTSPQPVEETLPVPPEPVPEDAIGSRSLDELNRDSPLKPAFFDYDSAELGNEAQAVIQSNAELMKRYPKWAITIEGHCDERGTAEYNLALGERRAMAVRTYLVSLGVSPDRLRTVSYGKEFPFDPGRTEEAYSKNRRAHFVITAK